MLFGLQENEALFIGGDSAVERIHLKNAGIDVFMEDVAEYINLFYPRTEDEDVAPILLPHFAAVD